MIKIKRKVYKMTLSVTQFGKSLPKEKYTWNEATATFDSKESYLLIDFNGNNGTFTTGDYCTFRTGSGCTFNTGHSCTFETDDNCTFNTGANCVATRKGIKIPIKFRLTEKIKQLLLTLDHLWVYHGFSSRLFSKKDIITRQRGIAEAWHRGYRFYHNGRFRELL